MGSTSLNVRGVILYPAPRKTVGAVLDRTDIDHFFQHRDPLRNKFGFQISFFCFIPSLLEAVSRSILFGISLDARTQYPPEKVLQLNEPVDTCNVSILILRVEIGSA